MQNKKYWLGILPHVYYAQQKGKALLYNTKTGAHILTDSKLIITLLEQMHEKQNLGVIRVEAAISEQHSAFIRESAAKNICFIAEAVENQPKPIQLMPVLNLQRDMEKLQREDDRFIGESVLHYLSDITIYLNDSCSLHCCHCGQYDRQTAHCYKTDRTTHFDFELLQQLFQQLACAPLRMLRITGGNIFEYRYFNELCSWLKKKKIYPMFGIHCQNVDFAQLHKIKEFPLEIFVNFPAQKEIVHKTGAAELPRCSYSFLITGEPEYAAACAMAEECHLENYKITPIYTGNNVSFFEENIYVTEQDIVSERVPQRMIFAHQKLNSHFFGALHIYPNGDVKANPNQAVTGNIVQDKLLQIAERELTVNTAWRQIRNGEPCGQCLYQFLCPSPSNYEWVIGRQNLCSVQKMQSR
ncbi:MAG: TIGR04150 pseudo-rSAM protein [Bacteroidales bacterium]|nr:TIGR04150 pseudo-rSAM protein [Bacteroidales bacterium]